MDRRTFFRRSADSLKKTVVKGVESRVNANAAHWIRPPYALPELEFLLACSRCKACVEACPHQVIFLLPIRIGVKVAGTPALDLLHKGCHLCADWPCVTACEPAALLQPVGIEEQQPALPTLALASIIRKRCLPYQGPECGACIGSCPVPDAMTWISGKPQIEEQRCIGCALCREACILEDQAIDIISRSLSENRNRHEGKSF